MRVRTTGARRVALALAGALLAPVAIVGAGSAPAGALPPECDRTWLGGNGSWTDATQWSGGVVPTATDDVCITDGVGTVEIRATSVTVNTLQLGSRTDDGLRTLMVVPNGAEQTAALTAPGGIDVQYGGSLVLGGISTTGTKGGTARVVADIANGGTVTSSTGSGQHTAEVEGTITNPARLRVFYPLRVDEVVNTGFVEMESVLTTDRFEGYSGYLYGNGGVETTDLDMGDLQTGLTDHEGWPLLQVTDGRLDITGDEGTGRIQVHGDVDMTGIVRPGQTIVLDGEPGQPSTLRFAGDLLNTGTIQIEPDTGQTASLIGTDADAAILNEGAIGVWSSDDSVAVIGADVANEGFFTSGYVETVVEGDLASDTFLDLRQGELQVEGDLLLGATGILRHVIDPEERHGHAVVGGEVDIDGVLDTYSDGSPEVGADYRIVESAGRTGTFRDHVFGGFPAGAGYDLLYTAGGFDVIRRAPESPLHRFVRAAYQDFLGRQPSDGQLEQRVAALEDGSLTRASLVRLLARSTEYLTALVQDMYVDTLGRPGDHAGVTFWVEQLRTGRKTVAQVAGAFYGSEEYIELAGGTPASWIETLFPVLLGRPATDDDRIYWGERAVVLGPTRVAIELFQSLESRRARVAALYLALLDRTAERAGVNYWAGRLTQEGDLVLAVHLAASAEYVEVAGRRYP